MSDPRQKLTHEVEIHAALPARVTADDAIASVMCTLTERLTAGEAHDVLASLPEAIRPLFSFCVYHREGRPVARLHRAEFIDRVATHLGVTPAHAELITAVVFDAVTSELPPKLVDDVAHQLPRNLQPLWREPLASVEGRALETTREDTSAIIDEIRERAELPDGVSPAPAFWAVMCSLSERLSGGEARDVALGLPASLRALVDRCMLHRVERADVFDRAQFLHRVAEHLGVDADRAEAIARAVFAIVKRVLPTKEVNDVASQLPPDMREMWASS